LLPSPSSLGQWLASEIAGGGLVVLAPPGVPLFEPRDSEELWHWRRAVWSHADCFDFATRPESVTRLGSLASALERVPHDGLGDVDAHVWMITATESHADALERLSILLATEPGPGVVEAVANLRRVVRRHREQAAQCSRQQSWLVSEDRSPQELARVVMNDPNGVVARVEQELSEQTQLTQFAAALEQTEHEFGEVLVRDALTSLVFAKHHSYSFRVTKHVRVAHRTLRHRVRDVQRLVAIAQDLRASDEGPSDKADATVTTDDRKDRLTKALRIVATRAKHTTR
jgi:hypothetical protein